MPWHVFLNTGDISKMHNKDVKSEIHDVPPWTDCHSWCRHDEDDELSMESDSDIDDDSDDVNYDDIQLILPGVDLPNRMLEEQLMEEEGLAVFRSGLLQEHEREEHQFKESGDSEDSEDNEDQASPNNTRQSRKVRELSLSCSESCCTEYSEDSHNW
ncbi:hypothetical protein C8Q75DRAFT_734713 [Abortiporus biennis]|nr:hypothetical protein C8Q75DRAFT_734713 [Abortiporus biennis]